MGLRNGTRNGLGTRPDFRKTGMEIGNRTGIGNDSESETRKEPGTGIGTRIVIDPNLN